MRHVTFGWDTPLVAVAVPNVEWQQAVESLFPWHVIAPQAARADVSSLDVPSLPHVDPEVLSEIEIRLTLALLGAARDEVHLHASGAVVRGMAVLAVGPSGAGKSSVGFAWHRLGHRLLGDDTVLVGTGGRARAFRRLMKVHRDRALEADVRPDSTLAWDPGEPELWYDPGAEGWAVGRSSVAIVARVAYRPSASLEARRLRPAEVLNLLVHSRLAGDSATPWTLEGLTRIAEEAQGYDVTFGSSMQAAAWLAARVGR